MTKYTNIGMMKLYDSERKRLKGKVEQSRLTLSALAREVKIQSQMIDFPKHQSIRAKLRNVTRKAQESHNQNLGALRTANEFFHRYKTAWLAELPK